MTTMTLDERASAVRELAARMRAVELRQLHATSGTSPHVPLPLATGWKEIDRAITNVAEADHGGLAVGAMHEWIGLCNGAPEARRDWSPPLSILLHLAWRSRMTTTQPGKVIWIGRQVWPMPTVLAQGWNLRAGLLDQSLFIDVSRPADRVWAIDLALRTAGVRMVIADGSGMEMAASRRLQLAAESGTARGVIGILARPAHEESMLSCATTRWLVSSVPLAVNVNSPNGDVAGERFGCVRVVPRWSLELLRCKGVQPTSHTRWRWVVEADHGKGLVCLPADVAYRPTAPQTAPPVPTHHRFTRHLRQAS